MKIEQVRERVTKNGVKQALQMQVGDDGKRKPMGWVTIGRVAPPGPPVVTAEERAGKVAKVKPKAPEAVSEVAETVGWALGGIATAALLWGAIWVALHRVN